MNMQISFVLPLREWKHARGLSALVCNPGVSVVVRRSRLEKRHRLQYGRQELHRYCSRKGCLSTGKRPWKVNLKASFARREPDVLHRGSTPYRRAGRRQRDELRGSSGGPVRMSAV